MIVNNLFKMLVEYHCSKNLDKCLPYIRDGRAYDPKNNQPISEGNENEIYKGLLIVANGNTLVEKLIDGGLISEEDMEEFVSIKGKSNLFNYLDSQVDNDGAFLLDGRNRRITRVSEIKNNVNVDYASKIPYDFIYSSGSSLPIRKLGTKTRLAIKLPPSSENIETFQIKRTAYTPLGMGKVTHFDKDGLLEEFFLMYNPVSTNGKGIVGIHRNYKRSDDKLICVKERLVEF